MNFTPAFEKTKEGKKKDYELVTKYMATNLITFSPEMDIEEALNVFLEKKISGAPVLDSKGHLVGMLSEKDGLKILVEDAYHNLPHEGKVADYMSKNVSTVRNDMDVVDVANAFLQSHFRRFPVVDEEGVLQGQVSRRDILGAAKKIAATTW